MSERPDAPLHKLPAFSQGMSVSEFHAEQEQQREKRQAEIAARESRDVQVQQVLFPYGIGIDTHSQFIAVCVLVQQGDAVVRHERDFKTTWPEMVAAHEWCIAKLAQHSIAVPDQSQLRYCIESTGTYHLPVLKAWGGTPTVVNPMLAAPTRRKTDVLDARLLAHHSITGMWPKSFIPTEQAQTLRVLWAQRREAVRNASRCSNRINNIILRFGHTLGRDHSMRTSIAEGVLSDLVEGKVPKMATIAPDGLPEPMRPVLAALLEEMHTHTGRAKKTQEAAREFVCSSEWPTGSGMIKGKELLTLLQTVPGVGVLTSLAWLSEVCDPRRFQDKKQVAAYCGCDPSLKTSAGKVTSFVRRSGNTKLHAALLYAAASLLRTKAEPIGQWAASIAGRHKKGGYRKAVGAAARRISVGLWHVHRTAQPFSYSAYNLESRPGVREVAVLDMVSMYAGRLLKKAGLKTSLQVAAAYFDGSLSRLEGFGEKSMGEVKDWIKKNTVHTEPPKPKSTFLEKVAKKCRVLDADPRSLVSQVREQRGKDATHPELLKDLPAEFFDTYPNKQQQNKKEPR